MGWKERLFERPLSRAFDDDLRREIDAEFERRRHEIPDPGAIHLGPRRTVILARFAVG